MPLAESLVATACNPAGSAKALVSFIALFDGAAAQARCVYLSSNTYLAQSKSGFVASLGSSLTR